MSNEQKQLIREKFETKEWNHWSSFQSKFIRLPDSTKKEIADFWLNELDLATKETERVTEERIVKQVEQEFSMFTLQDWSGEQEIYDQLDTLKDDIFDLIRNK